MPRHGCARVRNNVNVNELREQLEPRQFEFSDIVMNARNGIAAATIWRVKFPSRLLYLVASNVRCCGYSRSLVYARRAIAFAEVWQVQ